MKKIVIIGAGASGVLCSIYLKKFTDAKVFVLEANDAPLKKLSATGNGRCNLSNKNMDISHYSGKNIDKINNIIDYDIVNEFLDLGILTKYQDDLLYPRSEQALTVKNCLYNYSLKLGVKYYFNEEVLDINYDKHLVVTSHHSYQFDECILAFGTPAGKLSGKTFNRFRMLEKLGLKIVRLEPSLVQMKTSPVLTSLKGVRIKGSFSLYDGDTLLKKEQGELLFTDYGVSGIAIMKLSQFYNHTPLTLEIDMFDDIDDHQLYKYLIARRKQGFHHFYDGMLNSKLSAYLENLNLESVQDQFYVLKHMRLKIIGLNDIAHAQVLRGGLSLDEVDESLQIHKYPGIYALGELLDVTGECGGYNLHFAFSSAYWVAKAIGEKYYA